MGRKSPEWREFERLVAMVESAVVGSPADIQSPAQIPDRVTGQLREVDIAIRRSHGTSTLVTIECRRRRRGPAVDWIEQLVTKRGDIGATKTIAVSSTPFSKQAIEKARHHGIETWLMREITQDMVTTWLTKAEVQLATGVWHIAGLRPVFRGIAVGATPPLTPQLVDQIRSGDPKQKIVRRSTDDQLISISELVKDCESKSASLQQVQPFLQFELAPQQEAQITFDFPKMFIGIPSDGQPVERGFRLDFAPSEATMETVNGPMELESLEVRARVAISADTLEGRHYSYREARDEARLVGIIQHKVETPEMSMRVVITHSSETPD